MINLRVPLDGRYNRGTACWLKTLCLYGNNIKLFRELLHV
jgi:hypothetical protein